MFSGVFRGGQLEAETGGRTVAQSQFPAEQACPALRQGEPEADAAGDDIGTAAAAERAEDRAAFGGRDAGAAVFHFERDAASGGAGPQPDAAILGATAVL